MPAPDERVALERIVRVGAVDSTQRVAFDLAAAGALDGTVVVADYQTAGRGRRGRVWRAGPGTSLLASIVTRPRLAPLETPRLSFVAAIAAAEAIDGLTGATPALKWPNDVLLHGRKVAGILLESRTGASLVVIGIGVNLSQTSFPDDVRDAAVSVLQATGIDVERDRMLAALLERFDHWRGRLERTGFAPVRERWLALADTIGRTVQIDGVAGRAVDLAPDGALVVDDGTTRRRVVAGELGAMAREAAPRGH
jgi:BirA family biotin operon repressor/biotin-[acetyl-CoA-carboxylase] ligase